MKLSHTAIEMYKNCPLSYMYKYVQGYRETLISSALFFGGAVGETWQMMILDKKENLTEVEKKLIGQNAYDFFDSKIATTEHNGDIVSIPTDPRVRYFKGDYDGELLTDDDNIIIANFKKENGFADWVSWDKLYPRYKIGDLDNEEYSFMNLVFWLSVRRKGHLMIEAYEKEIIPKIHKVYDIEKEIKIENGSGDVIVGFLDMICDYEVEEGVVKKVLFDHKTSGSPYKNDDVITKPQLSYYEYVEEVGLCGYIVAIKNIKRPKRGARKGETYAQIQVIIDEIPEDVQENVILSADQTLKDIKGCNFEKNEGNCIVFGRRCAFYNLCMNDDDSDLFNKKDMEEDKE